MGVITFIVSAFMAIFLFSALIGFLMFVVDVIRWRIRPVREDVTPSQIVYENQLAQTQSVESGEGSAPLGLSPSEEERSKEHVGKSVSQISIAL